ncbi:MAG TPA: adenosylcobinamide-GDP ribazoletransferase, partial [Nitrospiraceae bacterium]|nr:adenosylcobinamide-GDP ribazoletransferase [Nitrospiraceae bacterium]
MIKSLSAAFGFLTVFPIPLKRTLLPGDMGKSMAFFPVVGVILGGILLLADKTLLSIFPRSVADLILISLLALITGGVHLDGLADTFDGLYGGKTREEALSIMK